MEAERGYRTQTSDTSRESEELLFSAFRRMTPAEKWVRVGDLNHAAREFALAGLRRSHPGADEHELRLRLAARHFDRATMIAAFGWDPEQHA